MFQPFPKPSLSIAILISMYLSSPFSCVPVVDPGEGTEAQRRYSHWPRVPSTGIQLLARGTTGLRTLPHLVQTPGCICSFTWRRSSRKLSIPPQLCLLVSTPSSHSVRDLVPMAGLCSDPSPSQFGACVMGLSRCKPEGSPFVKGQVCIPAFLALWLQ